MRSSFIFILIAFTLISCASTRKIDKPYMWKATKNDKSIVLFGTVHLSKDEVKLSKSIKSEIDNSEVVFVEVRKNKAEKVAKEVTEEFYKSYMATLRTKMQGWQDNLSPEAYRNAKYMHNHHETQKWLTKFNLNVPFEQASPALLEATYLQFAVPQMQLGVIVLSSSQMESLTAFGLRGNQHLLVTAGGENAIDFLVSKYAYEEKRIPVLELDDTETLKNSISIISGFDKSYEDYGTIKIEGIFGDMSKVSEKLDGLQKIVDGYFDHKPDVIIKAAEEDSQKEIYKFILKERNEMWNKKIIQANKVQNVFVAAGVLHFLGDDNLLNMLAKEGYTIQKL